MQSLEQNNINVDIFLINWEFIILVLAMDWIVFPQNSYVEALNPQDRIFKED